MGEAVQYIRVSSDEQSKGGSLDAQVRDGGEYITKKQLDLVAAFRDVETAKASGREQFGKMLEFLHKQKKPVVLLVEKTDRLYRNYEDMVAVQKLVKSREHEVHLYKEDVILNKQTPSHVWLMHYFKVAMATNYVENLSEEIKKGRREKLLKGQWPHRAPYGYRNNKELKTIEIREPEATFVREAFGLFSSGLYSLQRLREKLLGEGYVYSARSPKIPNTALWELLKSPFYIGQMEIQGEIYEGKHPPLVNKATWLLAQKALRKDNKPLKFGTLDFRYQHLLKCITCGASMVGESKKGGKYVYYRCARQKYGCSQGYVNQDILDKQFDAMILSLKFPTEYKLAIIEAAAELDDPENDPGRKAMAQAEADKHKLRAEYKKALKEWLAGNIAADIWDEMNQEYQDNMRALEARSDQVARTDVKFSFIAKRWVELPETLEYRWPLGSAELKLNLLNFVGSNFRVEGQKIHYDWKEPFDMMSKGLFVQSGGTERMSSGIYILHNREKLREFFLEHCDTILRMSDALAA